MLKTKSQMNHLTSPTNTLIPAWCRWLPPKPAKKSCFETEHRRRWLSMTQVEEIEQIFREIRISHPPQSWLHSSKLVRSQSCLSQSCSHQSSPSWHQGAFLMVSDEVRCWVQRCNSLDPARNDLWKQSQNYSKKTNLPWLLSWPRKNLIKGSVAMEMSVTIGTLVRTHANPFVRFPKAFVGRLAVHFACHSPEVFKR